jgi:hypothetical protein
MSLRLSHTDYDGTANKKASFYLFGSSVAPLSVVNATRVVFLP